MKAKSSIYLRFLRMAMEFKASRSIPSVQATQWHDLVRWGQSALVLWRPSIAGGDSTDQPTNRIVGCTSFHEAKRQIFCHHPADRHLSFDLLLAWAKAFEMGRKSPETSVSHGSSDVNSNLHRSAARWQPILFIGGLHLLESLKSCRTNDCNRSPNGVVYQWRS
jgi:hypothetical protein